jgi:hypothetical protein
MPMVIISVFLFDRISQHDSPKKSNVKSITKDLFGNNATKLPYFEGKNSGVVIIR